MRILILLLLVGCVSAPKITPTVPLPQRPEVIPLPPDASTEPLESEDLSIWSVPVEPDDVVVKPGILLSEALAERYINIDIGYEQLRKVCIQDRKQFTAQRDVYEDRIQKANEVISTAAPSWWGRNKFFIGIGTGLFLGLGSAVMLAR